MKVHTGDTVRYENLLGVVVGFKDNKIQVKFPERHNMFGDVSTEEKTITLEQSDVEVLQSALDHFFIVRDGKKVGEFQTIQQVRDVVTPANMKTIEIYSVARLQQPTIQMNPPRTYTQGIEQFTRSLFR